jgi:hypothetical protein
MGMKRTRRNPSGYDDRTSLELIENSIRAALKRREPWATRYADAMVEGSMFTGPALKHSGGMAQLVFGWAAYADAHRAQFGSVVGDDSFLGPHWGEIGVMLTHLLNGDIGRLDGGLTDTLIRDIAELNGIDLDNL